MADSTTSFLSSSLKPPVPSIHPKSDIPIKTPTPDHPVIPDVAAQPEDQPPALKPRRPHLTMPPYNPNRMEYPSLNEVITTACIQLNVELHDCVHGGATNFCYPYVNRYWTCIDDYKRCLQRMGYHLPGIRDTNRDIMLRESSRIVKHAWTMNDQTDIADKFFDVKVDKKTGKLY